jgi:hypothetical protein
METADRLVKEFSRLVSREGGSLALLGVEDEVIRVRYRPGLDPACESGSSTLPHLELQQLMDETLSRRAPGMSIVVELEEQNAEG